MKTNNFGLLRVKNDMGLRELSLFSGAGGGVWGGLLLGWETVCYVEHDSYCQQVLRARIRDGLFHDAPIWDDVVTFDGLPWRGQVDVVTAGFPCQPWSTAGKRKGEQDNRNLWPATSRVIGEVRPRFVFLENVPRLTRQAYFGTIIGDLAKLGYDAAWSVLSAASVGALHLRKRLFILAKVPDAHSSFVRPEQVSVERGEGSPKLEDNSWWTAESEMDRTIDGVPDRSAQLKAAGNAQVPGVVVSAWNQLNAILDQ